MKKFINNMVKKAENMGVKAMCKAARTRDILANRSGEAYLDLVIFS